MTNDSTPPPPGPKDPASVTAPSPDALEQERKYLETLFNSRFNFYLVFISLFFVAILQQGSGVAGGSRSIVLLVGTLASMLMWLAILRTHLLLAAILERLRAVDSNAYRWAYEQQRSKMMLRVEANRWLVWFPFITTVLLFGLFIWSIWILVYP